MQRQFLAIAIALSLTALSASAASPAAEPTYLQNEWSGRGQCLDVVNDGTNNQLLMAACGQVSGQQWTLSRSEQPGYVRLHNQFTTGARCLDVVNDGRNDQVQMAACANASGQLWKVSTVRADRRYVRLTNQFTGRTRCLESTATGLRMKSCSGDIGGQRWRSEFSPTM